MSVAQYEQIASSFLYGFHLLIEPDGRVLKFLPAINIGKNVSTICLTIHMSLTIFCDHHHYSNITQLNMKS